MLKTFVAPLTIGLLMAATAACSQQPPVGGPPPGGPPKAEDIIAKLDTDKDGVISKAESAAEPHMAKDFEKIDADQDGKVTLDELKAFFAKMKPPQPPQSQPSGAN